MKEKRFNLVLLLAVVLGGFMTYGQEAIGPTTKKPRTLEDYRPRTISEVSARPPHENARPDEKEHVLVRGDILPSRVRVIYVGRSRPLPQLKKDVLFRWAQLYAGAPEHYTRPYETELLFRGGTTDYWVAVKKHAKAQFQKEARKGKSVDLFLIRLGWGVNGNLWESVLLMENFQIPE